MPFSGGEQPVKSTNERGYGWHRHMVPRRNLLYNHIDGSECEYCGRPMFRDGTKNFDGESLHADHIEADKSRPPGRLIHAQCNRKMNRKSRWVKHGPEWRLKHQVAEQGLGVASGSPIVW
ncbi:hypothetical protein [Corynebacterium ulceribovis]|uniref:hypothetical protein n=1 Tax=Corynebacterium ulceribovis TaxID=487732 RepID=UPI0003A3A8B1|nr:hypothetical protein [Corynebacterium ulceribovis]